jgi:prepilin peptidase CpaA
MRDVLVSDSVVWAMRVLILCLLAWVVYSDTLRRKIPNTAVFCLLLFGCFFNVLASSGGGILNPALPGGLGLKAISISVGVVFCVGFFLFALKLWGAGDAKLLMGLAAWLQWRDLPLLLFSIVVMGGLIAVVRMVANRNAREVFANLQSIAIAKMTGVPLMSFQSADRMPFSWAIGLGWITVMVLQLSSYF